jgi:hypothetical protein
MHKSSKYSFPFVGVMFAQQMEHQMQDKRNYPVFCSLLIFVPVQVCTYIPAQMKNKQLLLSVCGSYVCSTDGVWCNRWNTKCRIK